MQPSATAVVSIFQLRISSGPVTAARRVLMVISYASIAPTVHARERFLKRSVIYTGLVILARAGVKLASRGAGFDFALRRVHFLSSRSHAYAWERT